MVKGSRTTRMTNPTEMARPITVHPKRSVSWKTAVLVLVGISSFSSMHGFRRSMKANILSSSISLNYQQNAPGGEGGDQHQRLLEVTKSESRDKNTNSMSSVLWDLVATDWYTAVTEESNNISTVLADTTNRPVDNPNTDKQHNKTYSPPTHSYLQGINQEATTTYGLVVVRCHDNSSWILDVPTPLNTPPHSSIQTWRVVVYEKCGEHSTPYSIPAPNYGAEECNGYFDYLRDYYEDLPDVTVFLHGDSMAEGRSHKPHYKPVTRWSIGWQPHTLWFTWQEVQTAIVNLNVAKRGYVCLGSDRKEEVVSTFRHKEVLWDIWNMTQAPPNTIAFPPGPVIYKGAQQMALSRDTIQRYSQSTYAKLKDYFTVGDSRHKCCSMERIWHVFYGVDPSLPPDHTATDILQMTEPGTNTRIDPETLVEKASLYPTRKRKHGKRHRNHRS